MYNVLRSLNFVLLDICQQTDLTTKSGSVACDGGTNFIVARQNEFGTETSLAEEVIEKKLPSE